MSTEKKKGDDFKYLRKFWPVLIAFPVIFLVYLGTLLIITWPIEEWSFAKAGLFGDSFGAINALFSGLALIGVVVTVLLQQKEMRETRYEFEKAANAQERTAELTALSTLLDEYNHRYSLNEKIIEKHEKNGSMPPFNIPIEQGQIISYRGKIVKRLEEVTKLNENNT